MFSTRQYNVFKGFLPEDRVTIDLPVLWQAFGKSFPAEVGTGDARELLAAILEALKLEGYRFPAGKKLYDCSALPELPLWVKQPPKGKVQSFSPQKHLWSPELVFFASRSHLPNHEAWLAIDSWLKENRNKNLIALPLKERSYQIFGDEKALDSLKKTKPFINGLITLKTLKTFSVYEPLPTENGPPSEELRPALVVENHTTHWTLAEWNKKSGRYSHVVYGGGNRFSAGWEWLVSDLRDFRFSEIKYFGDIDKAGFDIANRSKASIERASGFSMSLDVDLYSLALDASGIVFGNGVEIEREHYDLLSGLPDELAIKVEYLFAHKLRVPQEALNMDILNSRKPPMAGRGRLNNKQI